MNSETEGGNHKIDEAMCYVPNIDILVENDVKDCVEANIVTLVYEAVRCHIIWH